MPDLIIVTTGEMILAWEDDLKEKWTLLRTKIWHSVKWGGGGQVWAPDWQTEQRGRPQVGQDCRWASLVRQETQTRAGDRRGPHTRGGSVRTSDPASSLLLVLILLPAPWPLTPTTSSPSILLPAPWPLTPTTSSPSILTLRYSLSSYEGMSWLNWSAHGCCCC